MGLLGGGLPEPHRRRPLKVHVPLWEPSGLSGIPRPPPMALSVLMEGPVVLAPTPAPVKFSIIFHQQVDLMISEHLLLDC